MSSSQQSLDGTPTERLKHHLENIQQHLIETGNYLGQHDIPLFHEITWKRVEQGYQLLKKKENDDQHDKETTENDDEPLIDHGIPQEPAIFSAVLQISPDNCWLTPCGYWKGPTQVTPKFEDLKLSFQAEQPTDDPFHTDFTHVLNNVHAIIVRQIENIADKNAIVKGFLSITRGKPSPLLKFRHILFEVTLQLHST